ncbi:MAG: class I SAM-dependent methyltransferase [Rhodobacteraceae bacterium]|nr:class I SAM-dependent methyltransferase [Paracoccaceae bacterium]
MSRVLSAKIVDGIPCYSADAANDYADYPDAGFDLTDANAQTSFWVKSRNRLFGWLVRRELERLGTARWLDIGCGTGDFAGTLRNVPGLSITGSEIYLSGLRFARHHLPDVEFIQYDVTEGRLDRCFDIVTAFDVLEHVDEDQAGMQHVAEMLSDDGVFILSVPQHAFLWSTLDEVVHHKRRYSRAEMVQKLKRAGFQPVRVTSHVFALFPLMVASRILDQWRGKPVEDDGAALEARVVFPPLVNWLFDKLMRIDEALIRLGIALPVGGTLVVVARKAGP